MPGRRGRSAEEGPLLSRLPKGATLDLSQSEAGVGRAGLHATPAPQAHGTAGAHVTEQCPAWPGPWSFLTSAPLLTSSRKPGPALRTPRSPVACPG